MFITIYIKYVITLFLYAYNRYVVIASRGSCSNAVLIKFRVVSENNNYCVRNYRICMCKIRINRIVPIENSETVDTYMPTQPCPLRYYDAVNPRIFLLRIMSYVIKDRNRHPAGDFKIMNDALREYLCSWGGPEP